MSDDKSKRNQRRNSKRKSKKSKKKVVVLRTVNNSETIKFAETRLRRQPSRSFSRIIIVKLLFYTCVCNSLNLTHNTTRTHTHINKAILMVFKRGEIQHTIITKRPKLYFSSTKIRSQAFLAIPRFRQNKTREKAMWNFDHTLHTYTA